MVGAMIRALLKHVMRKLRRGRAPSQAERRALSYVPPGFYASPAVLVLRAPRRLDVIPLTTSPGEYARLRNVSGN